MSMTLGQRIELIAETQKRLASQLARLNAEIQQIIREIQVDIPESEE